MMVALGFPHEDDASKPEHIWVFGFPVESPKHAVLKDEMTALESFPAFIIAFAIGMALPVYTSLEIKEVPEYTILKLLKEMRQPEMKRTLGFLVTFLKNLSSQK